MKQCCLHVNPIPANFYGPLTTPIISTGTAAVTSDNVRIHFVKAGIVSDEIRGTTGPTGILIVTIPEEQSCFFSDTYCQMEIVVYRVSDNAPLKFQSGTEFYDCLSLGFSPVVCIDGAEHPGITLAPLPDQDCFCEPQEKVTP